MSENKFIKKLKGESTAKSVLEIKNQSVNTSFANMPYGTSDANRVYADHSGDAVGVLKGAENWKLNGSTLVYASSVNSDGNDYTGETDKTGGSVVLDGDGMAVSGAGLWVNATYTFAGDPTKTVAIFTAGTKWALKLCGRSLFSDNKTIDLTVLIKIGTSSVISKVFTVTTDSFNFCKDLVIDFAESTQTITKVQGNETLKLQVLCSDTSASATIYNGMTVLTSLQRRVDMDAIAGGGYSLDGLETELDNIHSELDGKLNLDGTNTMTGVLKMRASVSFECAIAPYWHGVGFYKLNDDDSVSLMASMEATDGFEPGTNNTYNIGSTSKKWKNLYLAGKAYVSTINNGFDIAVPVTNSADTLALKSEVDNAANSGRMIIDQGVWYAKMYAATVAPSAENGTNYADFSQTDGQGNPIIVTYNRVNGAWVQDQTITPPADYDGYVPITSKIWDITEQAGQQGGRILWNHQSKEFTPYPLIVSFEDIEVTGNSTVIMPATPTDDNITNKKYVDDAIAAAPQANTDLSNLTSTGKANISKLGTYDPNETYDVGTVGEAITGKANTDLDNLTSTGANIANWSSNLSNCITEIPQDINLELNNGTLTLKAGSKVYVPNGAGVFEEKTFTSMAIRTSATSGSRVGIALFDKTTLNFAQLFDVALANACSGTTDTLAGTPYHLWYDTTNNAIKYYGPDGTTNNYYCSLPIAMYSGNGTQISSIDQVFNGFGYIGSTVFVLPGVKGLIPNGRNADGTLKNIAFEISSVKTTTSGVTANYTVALNGSGILLDSLASYSEQENYNGGNSSNYAFVGSLTNTSGVISNFNIKTTFHAVDYNEADFVVSFQRPTAQNNYTWYRKYKSGWVEQGGLLAITGSGSGSVVLPVAMDSEYYNVTISPYDSGDKSVIYTNRTSTGFDYSGNVGKDSWEVKGMAQV